VTSIVVAVVDSQGRGGPRGVYRLTVDAVTPGTGPRDFRLFTPAGRVAVTKNGGRGMPLFPEPRGHSGRIQFAAGGMPAGGKASGQTIPTGADGTLVTMEPGESPVAAAVTTWHGRGTTGPERPVSVKGHPLERLQPWLATEFAVAQSATKTGEFSIDW